MSPGEGDRAAPDEPTPTKPRWRRRAILGVLAAGVLWSVAALWLLFSARADLTAARDDLRQIRDDIDGSDLIEAETTARLRSIEAELDDVGDDLGSPLIAPFRVLPILGRQLESVDALAAASEEVVAISASSLDRMRDVLDDADEPDTDRVALAAQLRDVAGEATRALETIDLGPQARLVGPLHDARRELAEDLTELVDLTADVEVAAGGVEALFASDDCHLLFAANNAEMRAGSGMFLQAGELCFDDGDFTLLDMQSTSDLRLPDDAVGLTDEDLEANWGPLLPNAEFRNLALSPRFDVTGELAARMWTEVTGREVAGVFAVDPVMLEVLLGSTGAIEVDGITYRADDVVDQLLIDQYEDFLETDIDQDARRERLGDVAKEAVSAFDGGGWDTKTLIEDLPDAVGGRHVLAWSADPAIQDAFVSMGIAGVLEEDSLAVSILNRGGGTGGGKLDPFLEVDAEVSSEDPVDGVRRVSIDIRIENTTEEGEPTYVETVDEDVRFGVYEGILAVNLPGASGGGRIEFEDEPVPLYAVGADGPTRLVAASFELDAEEILTFRVVFDLPGDVDRVVVEPSARLPTTEWNWSKGAKRDRTEFEITL